MTITIPNNLERTKLLDNFDTNWIGHQDYISICNEDIQPPFFMTIRGEFLDVVKETNDIEIITVEQAIEMIFDEE